jgi:hypothetical protein
MTALFLAVLVNTFTSSSPIALALHLIEARELPPIVLVDERPADVSPLAEAWVRPGDAHVYVPTYSALWHALAIDRDDNPDLPKKLAAVLAHEAWHVQHGPDERGAYEAELVTLERLHASPTLVGGVRKAMRAALKKEGR